MCECKTPPPRAGNPLAAVYILVFCFLIRSPVYLAAQDESITIMAVGDIMLARGLSPLLEKNGHQYPFKNTGQIFENADVVIGNLECYISSQSLNAGNVFNFRASTSSVTGLKKAGFNVLTLAKNWWSATIRMSYRVLKYIKEGLLYTALEISFSIIRRSQPANHSS